MKTNTFITGDTKNAVLNDEGVYEYSNLMEIVMPQSLALTLISSIKEQLGNGRKNVFFGLKGTLKDGSVAAVTTSQKAEAAAEEPKKKPVRKAPAKKPSPKKEVKKPVKKATKKPKS